MEVVHKTVENLQELATQLIECAQELAKEQEEEEEEEEEEEGRDTDGGERAEARQVTAENAELLRREWASQVSWYCVSDDWYMLLYYGTTLYLH